jgi:hypothetical protein
LSSQILCWIAWIFRCYNICSYCCWRRGTEDAVAAEISVVATGILTFLGDCPWSFWVELPDFLDAPTSAPTDVGGGAIRGCSSGGYLSSNCHLGILCQFTLYCRCFDIFPSKRFHIITLDPSEHWPKLDGVALFAVIVQRLILHIVYMYWSRTVGC